MSDRYPYDANSVVKNAPEDPGIYRLIYQHSDGNFYVFYVGQSDDLQERLLDHLRPSEQNSCIKNHLQQHECYFRFEVVWSQAQRDRRETEEIAEYKPQCNKQRR